MRICKYKLKNAGETCAGAVGCLAHAGGEFATAPTAPLSKPYSGPLEPFRTTSLLGPSSPKLFAAF